MKIGFTEFSYGYAFTENLIRSSASQPSVAPVFPNLVQEATLGYDVSIDLPAQPLFFQFKLPELMVRDTAREITKFGLGLTTPFFRMPLMRRDLSDQHARLIDLDAMFPGAVFYASPTAASMNEFNNAYSLAQTHLKSVLVSPTDIGPLPDDKSHVVAYSASGGVGWLCSEPEEVRLLSFEDVTVATNSRLKNVSESSLEDSLRSIRERLTEALPENLRRSEVLQRSPESAGQPQKDSGDDEQRRIISRELRVLRQTVRVGLGVEFVIAQDRETKKADGSS